jgi:hypothetical protein
MLVSSTLLTFGQWRDAAELLGARQALATWDVVECLTYKISSG